MDSESKQISWEDFAKIELRLGTIVEVEEFPEAKKAAYKLKVDLGQMGIRKSSAQITKLYNPEDLLGKQVLCVCNFPPRQIGPFMSEILVTGFVVDGGAVVLATSDKPAKNGTKLS